MFVYNDARHDARVWREAATLREVGWTVSLIALRTGGLPEFETRPEGCLFRVGRSGGVTPGDASPFRDGRGPAARIDWVRGYWRRLADWRDAAVQTAVEIAGSDSVVWHGHDLTGLLPAARAQSRKPGPLIYDSHELFVEAGSAARLPRPAKLMLRAYEDRLARRADAVITVNESIRTELGRRFGRDPVVIMNCPVLGDEPIDRLSSPLRTRLGLGARPVMLHHGGIAEGRGIMAAVAALDSLPQDVALVLLGDGELVPRLHEAALQDRYRGRMFMHPAVPIEALPAWIAGADVGIIAFEAVDRNNMLGTPNKLFEYMAGGVPVVVSNFPEMGRIVEATCTGVVCDPDDPRSIASAVMLLLDESFDARRDRRRRCRLAAVERYNWGREGAKLTKLYGSFRVRT